MTSADLKSFRRALGLTQSEFARAVGVRNHRTVRKWECGEQDIPGPVLVIVGLGQKFPHIRGDLVVRGKSKG